VNAPPRPNRDKIPAVSERTSSMLARRLELDNAGRAYVIGYLSQQDDPAVLCALAGGIAGALTARITHAAWRKAEGGEWEQAAEGSEPECSDFARRGRFASAQAGVTAEYRMLPLGEVPDDAPGES